MSVTALDLEKVEQSAIEASNIGPWKFAQELLNRPYYPFAAVKITAEILGKGLGVASTTCGIVYAGLGKLVDTENFVFLFQDIVNLPDQTQKLAGKVSGWWNGSTTFLSLANQTSKFTGHIASTVGDYSDACSALKALGSTGGALQAGVDKISIVPAHVGYIGSALGALRRVGNYFEPKESSSEEGSSKLSPSLEKVRQPVVASKALWELGRDVSIFALSSLCLCCGGFVAVPAVISIGLSGSILGTRMVAYYREVQEKAIVASHQKMISAKTALKNA